MFLPRCMHVLCKTRCFQVDCLRIFVLFIHRIHRQKEHCLSFCSNSVLPVSILNSLWSVTWFDIRHDKCTWRNRPESRNCLVMKDQWDCVLNDLEELGGKEFLPENQYNTEIFSCFLFLLPWCTSTYQTNAENAHNGSEDNLLILQNSIAPSSSRRRLPWRRRLISFFDTE